MDQKTILLVEDEIITAMAETQTLTKKGYHVIHANSGEMALKIAQEKAGEIHLILMDIDLGEGIDGTETARLILKEYDIPIIFNSSHTEKEVVEKTEEITSYGYVVKNSGDFVLTASIKMAFKLFDANVELMRKKMEVEAANEEMNAANEELISTNEEFEVINEELLESQRTIQESENKFRSLYESMSDGMCVHELVYNNENQPSNYRILSVNSRFEKITGIPREQAVGKLATDLYNTQDPPFLRIYTRVAITGKPEFFTTFFEPMGKHFQVSIFSPELGVFATVFQDITEQKKAEQILIEKNNYYRILFESLKDLVCEIDTTGVYQFVSPSYKAVLGYDSIELIGHNAAELMSPDDIENATNKLNSILSAGSSSHDTWRFKHKNGEWRWMDCRSSVFNNQYGNLSIVVVSTDITERIISENELYRLNRIYSFISQINQMVVHTKSISNISNDACRIAIEFGKFRMAWIGIVNESNLIIEPTAWAGVENKYLSKLPRVSIDDSLEGDDPTAKAISIGKYFVCNDIASETSTEELKDEALSRGYHSYIVLPIMVQNKVIGSFNLYSSEPNFFNESEINLLTEVTADISYAVEILENSKNQELAEFAQKDSEEKYRVMLEFLPYAVAVHINTKLVYVNKAAIELMKGDSIDDFIGKSAIEIVHPDYRNIAIERIKHSLNTNEVSPKIEEVFITLKGDPVNVEVTSLPIYYQGKPAMMVVFNDITDQKLAEENLRLMLSQKEILMKELQHRIKNNLNIVSSLLGLEMRKLPDEKTKQVFVSAQNRIRSMSSVYSHLDLTLNADKVNLCTYLHDLANSLLRSFGMENFDLVINTESSSTFIETKIAVPLGIIINELITNSLKYAYPEEKNGKISIILNDNSETITLKIEDNGIGLPDDFDMKSADSLGLKIVNLLAEQIAAELIINSDNGTKIQIMFKK